MSVGRTSLLLAPLAIGARGVAFFVPVVIALWYGVVPATDAFFWVISVPTVLLILGSTTMGSVLVPVMATLRVEHPERVAPFIGAVASAAALGAASIGVVFALAAPVILPVLTTFDADTRALAVGFTWAFVPFLAGVASASVLKAACEVHGQFAGPAGAPVVRAVTTLLVVGVLRPLGPAALAVGVIAGNLAENVLLAVVLVRAGVRPLPSLRLPPELAPAARAFAPVLGGETMVAMNLVVDKLFAGTAESGSVSLLEYADRARMIPQTLLESTLMVVAFNAWAAARARGEHEGRHRAVATTLWWVSLLAPPVLAGMVIGREALIRLLYSQFTEAHVVSTADTLGAFLPGGFAALLGALIVKAHIVEGRYKLVLALGLLSFVLNAVLDAALLAPFGLVGLAMSTTITTGVVTVTSFARLAPDLRGALPRGALWTAIGLVAASAGLTLLAVATGFRPTSVTDPRLWLASLPFLGLLALGAARARRGP